MARYSKYASRKLWYSVGTSLLIFSAGLVAAYVTGFRTTLESVIAGLLGALGIYTGSSVGAKYVAGKTGMAEDADDKPAKKSKKESAED